MICSRRGIWEAGLTEIPDIADTIITQLKQAEGKEVSSRELCVTFDVSRAAIWKHIEALRGLGYQIEASPRRGYRLLHAPDLPRSTEVAPLLSTQRLGHPCRYVAETGSTNRDVAAWAQQGVEEGAVVTAGLQHAGRGRMTRTWFSPPDVNLYFSLLLRPAVEPGRAASLPLVAGLAVAEALAAMMPDVPLRIKWPNDVLIGQRKVCGILCEMQAESDCVRHIILGAGVNVNLAREQVPLELQERATSLCMESGRTFSRAAVLAGILNRFEPLYDIWCREGLIPLQAQLASYDALKGQAIRLMRGDEVVAGTACGIQSDGALLIQTDNGITPVYSGEAHIGA